MRNLKKFLALVLAFMMTMSLMVTAHADFVEDYTDRDEVENYGEAVDFLNGLKVFKGYEDGKFQPKAEISRAEVTAIVYRMMTGDVSDSQVKIYTNYPSQFSDVPHGLWYEGYVNYCANGLYVHGDPDGTFRPNDSITGYEVLAIVLRTLGYGEQGEFEGAGWETRTATTAKRLGVTDNVVEVLSRNATREMVAEILYQTLTTATVTYTYTYEKDVLVADTDTNRKAYSDAGYTGDLPIYDTLLYRNFQIVGQDPSYDRDKYGRPSVVWVKDRADDTVKAGTKYVPNVAREGTAGDPTADPAVAEIKDDVEAFTLRLAPVKTYYVEKTECDVAKEVNNDKSLKNTSEWVNGTQAFYDGDGTGADPYVFTRQLDALHTTVDTIGAQGRTTEIYKVDKDMDENEAEWNIVYIDTLLGKVTGVEKRTFDTNGHVYHPAKLHIQVNKNVNVTEEQTDADYDYKNGDLLLLNTWGQADNLTYSAPDFVVGYVNADITGTSYANIGEALRAAIPTAQKDFQRESKNKAEDGIDRADAIEVVGEPEAKEITVKATTGAAKEKTGLTATDSTNFKASNIYFAEAKMDTQSTDPAYEPAKYVPTGYSISMNNSLINKAATLYLDPRGNITGMTQKGTDSGIGVIRQNEIIRVGVGTYAMEVEIFKADNTTETIRLLTWDKDNDAFTFINQAGSTALGVDCKHDDSDHKCVRWNTLIAYEPVTTVNGVTYYGVTDCGWEDPSNALPYVDNTQSVSANGDMLVRTGVADTLRDSDGVCPVMNDDSSIIIASTVFDYSIVGGANQGKRVLGGLTGYTGFKTIPTIVGINNGTQTDVVFQEVDGACYIYPNLNGNGALDENSRYSFSAQPQISVDSSYLVLATVDTQADHATYKVLQNGKITELRVANTNDDRGGKGLNELVEAAMKRYEMIQVNGWDLNGNATSISVVGNLGACDNDSGAAATLSLLKDSVFTDEHGNPYTTATIQTEDITKVTVDAGLLKLQKMNGGSVDASVPAEYLTIADDCQVQIVNVSTGSVSDATLDHVTQYRKPASDSVDAGANVSELVYELNNLGYVCNIYIID